MAAPWSRVAYTLHGVSVSILARRTAKSTAGKPSVVLLHGLIAEGETFRRLIDALPDDRDYFAMDLPGAGYSERPTGTDVGFAGMAAVVVAAFRELGLERPILLGHSHGGAVALRCAATAEVPLSGLVLMCPAHPFSGHELWLVSFYLTRMGGWFAHSLPRFPERLMLFGFQRMPGTRVGLTAKEFQPYLHTLRGPGTVRHLLRLLGTWKADMRALGGDLREHPVSTPTLAIWGNRDLVVPVSTAKALLACFPASTFVGLDGVGHLPNEEAPQECAAVISEWMATLS